MQSLLPRETNILFNALFLRSLPESMRPTLADQGELPPGELEAAANLLQHTVAPLAASVTAPTQPPPEPHPTIHAI